MNNEQKNGLLIVLSGPAGVGKGTVVKELLNDSDYIVSVSDTTRSPRPGEEDGVHYFFITREQFEKNIADDQMLEYAEYVGNYYGTPKAFVESKLSEGKNVILEIETCGALKIKEKIPSAVMVFILPPSMEELEARLRGRGTESDEIVKKRINEAKREISLASKYDYAVVNKDNAWSETAEIIKSIVKAEKHSVKRMKF